MIQVLSPQKIGGNILNTISNLKGYYALFKNYIKNTPALKNSAIYTVLYRQIYFTGIEALSKITIIGILIGIVIITQVMNIVGPNSVLTGQILTWVVVRELGPLFAAIIIISRSCTAMASELGSMKINNEITNLWIMGINPFRYLVVPRITGTIISAFILTFYFQLSGIIGGLMLSSILIDIPFFYHLKDILSVVTFFEIGISFLKSIVFGLIISIISCYHGFKVEKSITQIPQATTKAVMQSLFSVFIFNGIITIIFFL